MIVELGNPQFDPTEFIVKQTKKAGAGDDVRRLRELRTQIQAIADDSVQVMKKNVFQNYEQFIETAKEISHLEGEVYELSHLLTEQRQLIDSMMELSLADAKEKPDRSSRKQSVVDTRNPIQQVLEKVDGCTLTDNPGRELLIDSDLTEIDPESFAPLRQIHAFLLTDGLMLTSWIPHRIGPARYKFESLYQLENLAVINVGETDSGMRNIFKLLVFPAHKFFQCDTARLKKRWMDCVDLAKKKMLREGSLMRQNTIRLKKEKERSPGHQVISIAEGRKSKSDESASEIEWLKELPDEVDVCIAQREFDAAVELLFEGREYLAECSDKQLVQEVGDRLDQRQQQLADVLCKELKTSGDKALQGGPKAARKAVTLLIRLNRSWQACDLFLKSRTSLMKHAIRELKLIDDPSSYVHNLTRIMCHNLSEAGREFLRLFPNDPYCFSVLSLWASGELKNYVTLLVRHVFDSTTNLAVVGRCVRIAFEACATVAQIGLDLSFELEKLLHAPLAKTIAEHRHNLLEGIKLRISEDKWRPYNLQSESVLRKYLDEMKDFGVTMDEYVCEQPPTLSTPSKELCWLWLTLQTCHFTRNILPFSRDIALLRMSDHVVACDDALFSAWKMQLQHLDEAIGVHNEDIVRQNINFTIRRLLPMSEEYYRSAASTPTDELPVLRRLVQEYPKLQAYCQKLQSLKDYDVVGDIFWTMPHMRHFKGFTELHQSNGVDDSNCFRDNGSRSARLPAERTESYGSGGRSYSQNRRRIRMNDEIDEDRNDRMNGPGEENWRTNMKPITYDPPTKGFSSKTSQLPVPEGWKVSKGFGFSKLNGGYVSQHGHHSGNGYHDDSHGTDVRRQPYTRSKSSLGDGAASVPWMGKRPSNQDHPFRLAQSRRVSWQSDIDDEDFTRLRRGGENWDEEEEEFDAGRKKSVEHVPEFGGQGQGKKWIRNDAEPVEHDRKWTDRNEPGFGSQKWVGSDVRRVQRPNGMNDNYYDSDQEGRTSQQQPLRRFRIMKASELFGPIREVEPRPRTRDDGNLDGNYNGPNGMRKFAVAKARDIFSNGDGDSDQGPGWTRWRNGRKEENGGTIWRNDRREENEGTSWRDERREENGGTHWRETKKGSNERTRMDRRSVPPRMARQAAQQNAMTSLSPSVVEESKPAWPYCRFNGPGNEHGTEEKKPEKVGTVATQATRMQYDYLGSSTEISDDGVVDMEKVREGQEETNEEYANEEYIRKEEYKREEFYGNGTFSGNGYHVDRPDVPSDQERLSSRHNSISPSYVNSISPSYNTISPSYVSSISPSYVKSIPLAAPTSPTLSLFGNGRMALDRNGSENKPVAAAPPVKPTVLSIYEQYEQYNLDDDDFCFLKPAEKGAEPNFGDIHTRLSGLDLNKAPGIGSSQDSSPYSWSIRY